jgi:hypothetical protein
MTAKKSCLEYKRKTWWMVPGGTGQGLHVAPSGDLRTHELHPGCWCGPRLQHDLFVHHAMDGRVWSEGGHGGNPWALKGA